MICIVKCIVRVPAGTRIHLDSLKEESVTKVHLEYGQKKGANKGFGGTLRILTVRSHFFPLKT